MNAKKEDVASCVLMPGDPLRAKYIAEKFLDNAKLVSNVRNMFCYTGTYKGKKVSIMGSGMGMSSMSIYAFELFHFYNVEKIIRIGTCGVLKPNIEVGDIVLAEYSYTETNFSYSYAKEDVNIVYPSKDLNNIIIKEANLNNKNIHVGGMITCEVFNPYVEGSKNIIPDNLDPISEEMESFALFYVANKLNKKATAMATVTDSKYSSKIMSVEDRERSLDDMIIVALNSITK